ncbi:MAG: hypothetical protein V7739_12020 [Motiliproteus sp.]
MLNIDAVAIAAVVAVLGSVIVLVLLWFKAKQVIYHENTNDGDGRSDSDE